MPLPARPVRRSRKPAANTPYLSTATGFDPLNNIDIIDDINDALSELESTFSNAGAFTVFATEAAMLASGAVIGDTASRSDLNETYRLFALPATTLTNWKRVATTPVDFTRTTVTALTIPAGTTSIAVVPANTEYMPVNGLPVQVTLFGIPGTLTRAAGVGGAYTFARTTAGSSTPVPAGSSMSTSTAIDAVALLGLSRHTAGIANAAALLALTNQQIGHTASTLGGSTYKLTALPASNSGNWILINRQPVTWTSTISFDAGELSRELDVASNGIKNPVYRRIVSGSIGAFFNARNVWVLAGENETNYLQTQAQFLQAWETTPDGALFEFQNAAVTINTPIVVSVKKDVKGRRDRAYIQAGTNLDNNRPAVTMTTLDIVLGYTRPGQGTISCAASVNTWTNTVVSAVAIGQTIVTNGKTFTVATTPTTTSFTTLENNDANAVTAASFTYSLGTVSCAANVNTWTNSSAGAIVVGKRLTVNGKAFTVATVPTSTTFTTVETNDATAITALTFNVLTDASAWSGADIAKLGISVASGNAALYVDASSGSKSLANFKGTDWLLQSATVPGNATVWNSGSTYVLNQVVTRGTTTGQGPYFIAKQAVPANTDPLVGSNKAYWKKYYVHGAVFDAGRGGVNYSGATTYAPDDLVYDGGSWHVKISLAAAGTPTTDGLAWEDWPWAAFIASSNISNASRDAFGLFRLDNCTVNGGLRLINCGDSTEIRGFRSSALGGTGLIISQFEDITLRYSSVLRIINASIGGGGIGAGGVWVKRSAILHIDGGNFELHQPIHDQGVNKGIINLDGHPNFPMRAPKIHNAFFGHNVNDSNTYSIVVNYCDDGEIDNVHLTRGPSSTSGGILITANTKNQFIGNVKWNPSSISAGGIVDNGQGTMGIWKPVTTAMLTVTGVGTISLTSGTNTITGTGTNFTAADVGKTITNPVGGETLVIAAVTTTTAATTTTNAASNWSGVWNVQNFIPKTGTTYETPQFIKYIDGTVVMVGLLTSAGTAVSGVSPQNVEILKFPAGFVPEKIVKIQTVDDSNTSMIGVEYEISTTGVMKSFRPSAGIGNAGLSLNTVRFFAPRVATTY